jgi:hypothetical protein
MLADGIVTVQDRAWLIYTMIGGQRVLANVLGVLTDPEEEALRAEAAE